jgi:hypothetical protein
MSVSTVVSMHWKVRQYILTGGRTRTRQPLLMHTLVSVPDYDAGFAGGLQPEARSLYECARQVCSIAELSATCGVSLGVTRVVVDDLAAHDRIFVHPEAYGSGTSRTDVTVLERLRSGLRKLA